MIEVLRRLGFVPYFCVWELTLTCDLRCQHCGSHAGAPRDDELDLDESLRLADDLAALGARHVTLSGGEPTKNPHWDTIARRLSERGVEVNLISNGFSWGDDHVRRALAAGLVNVGFSVDGLEEDHDHVRRRGSFQRVMEAIDRSVRGGLPAAVATHVNRRNRRTLDALRAVLASHGVSHWQLQLANPIGAMHAHPELALDPADLLWLVPKIAAMRTDGAAPDVCAAHNVGYFGACEPALRDDGGLLDVWVGCRAGCQNLGIESNGNVKGCLSLPSERNGERRFVAGNVRERPLAEIWADPAAFAFHRTFDEARLGGHCAECRYRDVCRGGCTWMAYDPATGKLDNPWCLHRQAVLAGRTDLLDEDEAPR